jgi:hypothetical protein
MRDFRPTGTAKIMHACCQIRSQNMNTVGTLASITDSYKNISLYMNMCI